MPLFEVVILEKPTKKQEKDGELERIVLPPTAVVASDEQSAGFSVVMDNVDLQFDKKRMQVLIRPFG